jgi:adenylate cyclase
LTDKRVERRLAAVLAADIAGYNRLMGADEEGTLGKLKALRKAIVDPKIVEHRTWPTRALVSTNSCV